MEVSDSFCTSHWTAVEVRSSCGVMGGSMLTSFYCFGTAALAVQTQNESVQGDLVPSEVRGRRASSLNRDNLPGQEWGLEFRAVLGKLSVKEESAQPKKRSWGLVLSLTNTCQSLAFQLYFHIVGVVLYKIQTVLSWVWFQLQLSCLLFSAESPPHPPPLFTATRGQMVVARISQALHHLLQVSVHSLALQPSFGKWGGGRARDFFCAVLYYVVPLRSSSLCSAGTMLCPQENAQESKQVCVWQRAFFNPILECDRTQLRNSIDFGVNKGAADHQALLWHQILLQCHLSDYAGGTGSHGHF